jgi:lipopolysaccharide heptosyltransferase II
MSNNSPRILCLSLSGIGNYLMHSPAIAALKSHYPDSHLTVWVAPRGTRALAANDSNVDEVIENPLQLPIYRHIKLTARLFRPRYDLALMFSPGQRWKGAAYMFLAGIKKRIAHPYPFRGNPNSSFLLTDSLPENPQLHDIDQNLNLLQPLAIVNPRPATYNLQPSSKDNQRAQQLLSSFRLPNNTTLIGLHPGSASDYKWKRWPADNFSQLAAMLIEKTRASILLFGGAGEESLKKYIKSQIIRELPASRDNIHIINTSLLTAAALMKACQLVIANDSGLMHLAAAAGAPVLGLFGPTNENKVGPRGPQSSTLRAPGTFPVYDINHNQRLGKKSHHSLRALPVANVLQKALSLI